MDDGKDKVSGGSCLIKFLVALLIIGAIVLVTLSWFANQLSKIKS